MVVQTRKNKLSNGLKKKMVTESKDFLDDGIDICCGLFNLFLEIICFNKLDYKVYHRKKLYYSV